MPVIRFFLSGVCHQWPDHCFRYQGQPLPLCARCMGAFLGVAIGLAMLTIMGHHRRSCLPGRRIVIVLIFLALAWVVDGVNSVLDYLGAPRLYPPSNIGRLLTGLGFGLAVAVVLRPIYQQSMWRQSDERPVLAQLRELAPLLAAAAGGAGLILFWRTAPWDWWAIAMAAAVALALAMTNATLIALLLRREGFAHRWIELAPFWAAGLVAALIETGAMAALRMLLMGQIHTNWP